MPNQDEVEVDLGYTSFVGFEPSQRFVSIRCRRGGEIVIEKDCRDLSEIAATRAQMKAAGFDTSELKRKLPEIRNRLGNK